LSFLLFLYSKYLNTRSQRVDYILVFIIRRAHNIGYEVNKKMSRLFGRKGQAALEFLTTYGWAFMVILVMIGALAYFGVLNPGGFVRDQCLSTTGVDCKSQEVVLDAATLSISFTNNLGNAIAVRNLKVMKGSEELTNGDCNNVVDAEGNLLPGGEVVPGYTTGVVQSEQVFMFQGCDINALTLLAGKKAGDTVKLTFTFEYIGTEPGEFSHMVSGSLTTKLK